MEKVMLSKVEAEALENAQMVYGGSKANIIQWRATELFDGIRAPLNEMDLDTICRALYFGYEVEKSKEDLVKDYYFKNIHVGPVISEVLNLLNIQIKGINC